MGILTPTLLFYPTDCPLRIWLGRLCHSPSKDRARAYRVSSHAGVARRRWWSCQDADGFVHRSSVIMGSFVTNGRKSRGSGQRGSAAPVPMMAFGGAPVAAPVPMMAFGAAPVAAPTNPLSQGPTSESSDENGGSPISRRGYFDNSEQPMHNVPIYTLWAE